MTYDREEMRKIGAYFERDKYHFDNDPADDGIIINNLEVLVDKSGEIQHFKKVLVPGSYPTIAGKQVEGTFNQQSHIYGDEGYFIPSMPMATAILERLVLDYTHEGTFGNLITDDSDHHVLLRNENFPFNPRNLNVTNTIVDFYEEKVVHYPTSLEINQTEYNQKISPIIEITEGMRYEKELDMSKMKEAHYKDEMPSSVLGNTVNIFGHIPFNLEKMRSYFGSKLLEVSFPTPKGNIVCCYPQIPNIFQDNVLFSLSTIDHSGLNKGAPLVKVIEE